VMTTASAPPRRVQLSVFCSHVDDLTGPNGRGLVDLARIVENAGADQIVLSEHVVLASEIEAHGPGGHPFPFPPEHVYPEPLITLAAMAGATARVRLATGILIAPLRPAVVLAKMAATLDVVSNGRLDLGVGAGWHRAELLAAGADPERATAMLEDIVGACRVLWSGGPASFDSPTVRFDDLHCQPVPVQGTAVPVWFAGPPVRSTFRRIARLGDGWLPFGNVAIDDIARGNELLQQAANEHGRASGALGIRASLPIANAPDLRERLDGALAAAPAFAAAGATVLQIALSRLATDLDDVERVVSTAAQAVAAIS
jgi:probable F420-dependent oxidoreductase